MENLDKVIDYILNIVKYKSSEGWHRAVFFEDIESEFNEINCKDKETLEAIEDALDKREEVMEVTLEEDESFYVTLYTSYSPYYDKNEGYEDDCYW